MQGLKTEPVIFTFAIFSVRILYFTAFTTSLQLMRRALSWVPLYG